MAKILEAVCGKCGETFVPYSEDDLEHIFGSDGQLCEGQGKLLGVYTNFPSNTRITTVDQNDDIHYLGGTLRAGEDF
jgi:hypothetical protein